jgi:chemosensory pili system protein ChpB (putative protein-glutamate methylesterase)
MPEPSTTEAAPRVVLLARAGKAADNLADALRQAGVDLLMAADPSAVDEAAIRALSPQALLVALEPSIESALDKLDDLLADPSLTVIFDEADLAAHRAGWDAARWARHLSAKLRHDTNVLPPGTESEQDWQPSPGQLPSPSTAYTDIDLAIFTREAVARAESVPSDGMPLEAAPAIPALDSALASSLAEAIPTVSAAVPPPLPPPEPAIVARESESPEVAMLETAILEAEAHEAMSPEPASTDAVTADDVAVEAVWALEETTEDSIVEVETMPADRLSSDGLSLEPLAVETAAFDDTSLGSASFDSVSLDSMQLEGAQLDNMQIDSMQLDSMQLESISVDTAASDIAPMTLDDDAFFLEELSAHQSLSLDTEGESPMRFESGFDTDFDDGNAADLDQTPTPTSPPLRDAENVLSFEELIAGSLAAAEAETIPASPRWSGLDAELSEASSPEPQPPQPKRSFSLEGLSLAPVDESPAIVEKPQVAPVTRDLSALEARISGLSLVDHDGDAPAPSADANAVVLIEAGLGGPDPARQLLASIPADFPAVVLVRLHLQGGRYDRLVAQMERASALPVALAEHGVRANPGTIYFMPDHIGLTADADGLAFAADEAPAATVFAALRSTDSAVVFLSGSDPQLVDSAMATPSARMLVMAQSPEDCYDGAACAELRKRGAASGLPAELAGRLASRWPG